MSAIEYEISFTRTSFNDAAGFTYSMHVRTPFNVTDIVFDLPPAQDLEERLGVVETAIALSSATVTQRGRVGAIEAPVQRFAEYLSGKILTDESRGLLRDVRMHARDSGGTAVVIVHLSDSLLTRIPWELLWDTDHGDYLALRVPIVRYAKSSLPARPLAVCSPLRVLVVVAGPQDMPELAVEKEKDKLGRSVKPLQDAGLLELDWMEGERYTDLEQQLGSDSRWHILHFIGHGGYDDTSGEGYLALVHPETGGTDRLSATEFVRIAGAQSDLRLVILNACETGRGAEDDYYAGTASTLVRNGMSAVIAMQYPVTDDAASAFTEALYSRVADFRPLDQAITDARKTVARSRSLEWATPVLYMRSTDPRLFEAVPAAADRTADAPAVEFDPEPEIDPDLEPEPPAPDDRPGDAPAAPTAPDHDPFLDEAAAACRKQDYDEALRIVSGNLDPVRPPSPAVVDLIEQIVRGLATGGRLGQATDAILHVLSVCGPEPRLEAMHVDLVREAEEVAREVEKLRADAELEISDGQLSMAASLLERALELKPGDETITDRLLTVEQVIRANALAQQIAHARNGGAWDRVTDLLDLERVAQGISPERLEEALQSQVAMSVAELHRDARIELIRAGILVVTETATLEHGSAVRWFGFSPDGALVVSYANDKRIRTWWHGQGTLLMTSQPCLRGLNRSYSMALDGSGLSIVMSDGGTRIEKWDVISGTRQWRVDAARDVENLCAATEDVFAVGIGPAVELRQFSDGAVVYRGYRERTYGRRIAVSGELNDVLLVTGHRAVNVWSLPDDDRLFGIATASPVEDVVADGAGRCVAAVLSDGTIQCWPDITSDAHRIIRGGGRAVACSVSRDGSLLLAGFDNGSVGVFDTTGAQLLATVAGRESVTWLSFAPDNRGFAVARVNGSLKTYRFQRER